MSIDPKTSLGAVHLTVSDLDRSLEFYTTRLGFQKNNQIGNSAQIGVPGRDLLILTEDSQAQVYRGTTGLYHFAIRVPTRLDLAYSLQQLANTNSDVQGFADHHVSEAVYLSDPDGTGIEIYRDRPRESWQYKSGQLKMGTDPLDLDGIFAELTGQNDNWTGLHPETTMGHVHLRVAQIDSAEEFYRDVIGFDLILKYGRSASFLAAGGYHHHIGINTWAGVGAVPPPPNSSGLRWFTIKLPDDRALQKVVERIRMAKIDLDETDLGYAVRDPSSNGILLIASGDSPEHLDSA